MTEREALKLALEALEVCEQSNYGRNWVWPDTAHPTAMANVKEATTAIKEALAQPEFTKHEVESAEDWSEWVCPDPKSYLMKCCDCGLVHEAQFGVVRYKSETEREDCDPVEDPNLQAVFRMRRSEQWSPADTAYRPGGLAQPEGCQCPACKVTPHASDCAVHNEPAYPKGECNCGTQPEQEPVAWVHLESWKTGKFWPDDCFSGLPIDEWQPLYTTPPQRKPLTDEQINRIAKNYALNNPTTPLHFARAIEAAHGIKE